MASNTLSQRKAFKYYFLTQFNSSLSFFHCAAPEGLVGVSQKVLPKKQREFVTTTTLVWQTLKEGAPFLKPIKSKTQKHTLYHGVELNIIIPHEAQSHQ